MIDLELRSKGVGASEVAAILGMDPRRDAFAVWARKLNLVEEPEPNIRMRRGKYFEVGISRWYEEETGQMVEWSDTTVQNAQRSWQLCTPDAFVVKQPKVAIGGVDCKMVAWDQREGWGDPGTDKVPDHYGIQNNWTCSTLDLPWWDVAACLGDELRVYRIHRDPQIEAVLLEVVEKFWKENVLGRTQPPIGATDTAKAYLKQKFPKNIEPLRQATPEEVELLTRYKGLREQWDILEPEYDAVEMQIREAIGEAEGLLAGPWKVTYKRDKDSMGTDWEAVSNRLAYVVQAIRGLRTTEDGCEFSSTRKVIEAVESVPKTMAELQAEHQIITRVGPRKLRPTFGKKGK